MAHSKNVFLPSAREEHKAGAEQFVEQQQVVPKEYPAHNWHFVFMIITGHVQGCRDYFRERAILGLRFDW